MAMSPGLKVFLWIIGIIGVLVLLFGGAGVYLGLKVRDGINEGREFAETASKTECMDEFAIRTGACDSAGCVTAATVFGLACLENSPGEKSEICFEDESPRELSNRYCSDYPDSQYCVEVINAIMSEYCR